MRRIAPSVAVLLSASCGGTPREAADGPAPPEFAAAARPPDSLALRTPAGIEIWFTGGRAARDSTGGECLERLLEIRDSSSRRGVPLLYTLEAPVMLDDSSVAARIFNGCRPGARYRVSLRTGRPTPLEGR